MIRLDLESAIQVADRLGDVDCVAILRVELAALDAPSEIQALIDEVHPVAQAVADEVVTEPSHG